MLYTYNDTEFGQITIATRRGQRSVRFFWRDGTLHMSIPLGATAESVIRVVNNCREQIRALPANTLSFHLGQVIQCYGCTVTLAEQDKCHSRITIARTADNITIGFPQGTDISSQTYAQAISQYISTAMERELKARVFPLAWELARQFHLAPTEFVVGRGIRKLGHCTASGSIQLSRNIMFLPEDLIRLIICHELAHLTHHNHSKEFHYLCNSYLGGQEKELERKLKLFKWPILR